MAAPRLTSLLLSSRRLVLLPRPALAAPRHLATSPVMAEYFFTKKHEWVNVEGDKGEHFYRDITLLTWSKNAIGQPRFFLLFLRNDK